jgi:antitoxin component YwqK of YwqJK toxin-antitoxin module
MVSKNGIMSGPAKRWYENGQQESDWNWENNEAQGICVDWYENGQIRNVFCFRNSDELASRCWDENGNETDCEL